MKNNKRLVVIGLVFLSAVVSAQNRPTLDSAYLVKEYENFKNSLSRPKQNKLSIYIFSGSNFTKTNPTERFYLFNSNEGKDYQSEIGYHLEVGVLIPIKKLDIGIGVNYTQQVFSVTSNLTGEEFSYNYKEKSNLFSIPLSLKYYFSESRLRPYVLIGAKFTKLLTSELSGHRNGVQPAVFKENLSPMRNRLLFFTSIGVGTQYTMRKGSFFMEVIYFKGTSNLSVADKRYSNTNLVFNGGYVSDNFKINSIAIHFGYAFSVFKRTNR